MARSAGRMLSIAAVAFVGHVLFAQLAAFVGPSPSYNSFSQNLRSRMTLAASKAEIAEATQHANLLNWAANTAAEKGLPTAAAARAKADQAAAELQALKAGGSAPPAAPVVSAPAPAAPAVSIPAAKTSHSDAEIKEAEEHVRLLVWAAKVAAAKAMSQTSAMQAKADAAVAALEALKAGNTAPSAPGVSTPVTSAPAPAMAAVASSGPVSKEEIVAAEKHANLLAWAAKTAAEKGLPQAAAMRHSAEEAAAVLEAMKSGESAPSAPVASASAASASVAASAAVAIGTLPPDLQRYDLNGDGIIDKEELAQAKKELQLIMWAARTADEKGMPQAAAIRANADTAQAQYKDLEAIVQ